MDADKHQVVYKNRLLGNTGSHKEQIEIEKLVTYFKDANAAASVMSEFFLNLFGGITPSTIDNAIYTTAKKKDQNDEEITNSAKPYPTPVLLFYNWFTLEDIKGADPELIVNIPDVIPTFNRYLNECQIPIATQWLESLQATVTSTIFNPDESSQKTQDRVWVDRRLGFANLQKQVNFKPETIKWIFENPDFLLQEKKVKGHEFAGSFFSTCIGDGKKSDFNSAYKKCQQLRTAISGTSIPDHELAPLCRQILGIKPGLAPKNINHQIFRKQGKPNTISRFIAGEKKGKKQEHFSRKEVLALLDVQLNKDNYRTRMPKDNAWERVSNYLVSQVKLPYARTFYVEFAGMALERILSHRKNSLNTLTARHQLDRKPCEIPAWLSTPIDIWCHDHKQKHLWDGDIEFKQLRSCFVDNLTTTVNLIAKKQYRHNLPFMKMIAEVIDKNTTTNFLDFLDMIQEYQKITKNICDYLSIKTPRLARFTNLPNHPQFGTSRPGVTYINSVEVPEGQNLPAGEQHSYDLEILTKTGQETVRAITYNKRAKNDLIKQGDAKTSVSRRSKLLAMQNGVLFKELAPLINNKNAIENNAGVKLVVGKSKYNYLYVTFELESLPCATREELSKMPEGYKFLAFDPGIRNNVTFAVGEIIRSSQSVPYLDKGRPCLPIAQGKVLRIIETGVLNEKDFKRQGKHTLCRLESRASSDTTPEAEKLFEKLKTLNFMSGDCPVKMPAFIKEAIASIKRHARNTDNPNVDILLELTELLKHKSNVGHLSYARILNLKSLKSLYQLYNRKAPGLAWIEESLEYATKKVFNTRHERFRRVANLVCQKAIEHGVKAVFPENTTLDIHFKSPRWQMKMVDIWTPRQVLEQCKTQLNALGFYVQPVVSNLSSHTDFAFDNVMKPRWHDLTVKEIYDEIEYYASITRPQGSTLQLYKNEINAWLARHGWTWSNWKENFNLKKGEKFPFRKGGDWFFSSLHNDYIKSDENAAIFLLCKGVKDISSSKKKTTKRTARGRVMKTMPKTK